MSHDLSLHQRRRQPHLQDLEGIPWLSALLPAERAHVLPNLLVGDAKAGDVLILGKPVGVGIQSAALKKGLKLCH